MSPDAPSPKPIEDFILSLGLEPRAALDSVFTWDTSVSPPEGASADLPTTALSPGAAGSARAFGGEALFLGHYRIERYLGAGGMGRVYLATDLHLRRQVALKILQVDEPEYRQRFLEEARSQARIEHPRVAKVFEVGAAGGRPFLAMQFIDGPTLKGAAQEASLEARLRLLAQACEGVHAAHREGVLHRDLKPANILVEADENGQRYAFVVDFGLATPVGEAGGAFGTPAYMSPEQIRREPLDRRSDIYALGATLYELLTGHPPFTGATLHDLLRAVLEVPPPPPRERDPSIPPELEAICLRALEKRPEHRYPSARALGEDLRNYLDGAPVEAMGRNFRYRAGTWVKRHRAMAALAGLSLSLTVGFAAWGLRATLKARTRAIWAQRFGQEAQELEGFLARAYLAPPHDLRPDLGFVRARMDEIRAQVAALPAAAQGPGYYALGRGYLALDDARHALEAFQGAWSRGYREADLRFARGSARVESYRAAREEAERLPAGPPRQEALQEARTRYLQPALEDLETGRSGAGESRWRAQALIALCEDRLDDAVELARRAMAEDRWTYAGSTTACQALLDRAGVRLRQGDGEGARRDLATVDALLGPLETWGRSDPRVRLLRIERWALDLQVPHGPDAASAVARVAFDQSLEAWRRLEPPAWDGAQIGARVYIHLAERAFAQGHDPADLLGQARTWAAWAVAHGSVSGQVLLGQAANIAARSRLREGADPTLQLREAQGAFQRAEAGGAPRAMILEGLAANYATLAAYQAARGQDQGPALDRSAEILEEEARRWPGSPDTLRNLGAVHTLRADYRSARGLEAAPDWAAAAQAFRAELALDPPNAEAHALLGNAEEGYAKSALAAGQDPGDAIVQGRASCEAALRLDPREPTTPIVLAYLAHDEARWRIRQGRSPESALAEMARRIDAARRLNPRSTDLPVLDTDLELDRLEHLARAGREVKPLLRPFLARLAVRLAGSPEDPDLLAARAVVLAEAAVRASGAARSQLGSEAERTLARALYLSPRGAKAAEERVHALLAPLKAG